MAIIRPAKKTRTATEPRRLAPALDALEERLLTLRADAEAAEPPTRPLPFPRERAGALPPWRRHLAWAASHGRGAFWVVILAICGTSAYVISGGGASTHAPALPEPAFAASATGSGRLAVPMTAGDLRLRVDVEPAARGKSAWFWCLDSDRGLPPEQHICAAAGPGDPASGAVTSGGVVHVAAAQAGADSFFVQMYCPGGCRWRALVSPDLPVADASPVALSSSRR
jgi:hypothetical protein